MSVDDRLREAFGETDLSWDEQVPAALATITARRRRETLVRRGTVAAVAAAAAVAAIAVSLSQPGDQDPPPTPDPTPPVPTSTDAGAQPNPLDGTWVSPPMTRADVRRAARLAGDAGDVDAMVAGLPALPFRVVLYVDADRSYLHTAFRAEDSTEELADEENMTVTGDRVVMQPMFADGENVHTYVLDGDTLRLRFESTTEDESDGVPAEAWQRFVYDTAAFTSGT